MAAIKKESYMCLICDKSFQRHNDAIICEASHHQLLESSTMSTNDDNDSSNEVLLVDDHDIESQDDSPRSTPTGTQSKKLWIQENTLLFINMMKGFYPKLSGKATARNSVWKEITTNMQSIKADTETINEMPNVTLGQLKSKWKNIKFSYYQYLQNMKTTGEGQLKTPPYFEEVNEILGERPLSSPNVVSSGLDHLVAAKEQDNNPDDPAPIPGTSKDAGSTIKKAAIQNTSSGKVKKIRPPSTSAQNQLLRKAMINLVKESNEKLDKHVAEMIATQKEANNKQDAMIEVQRERNEIIKRIFDVVSPKKK